MAQMSSGSDFSIRIKGSKPAYKSNWAQSSLLSLPDEVVNHIIYHLTYGLVNLNSKVVYQQISANEPSDTFAVYRLHHELLFSLLVPLSSCCIQLRSKLAPILFEYVSLIRTNDVDAILSSPKGFDLFSDGRSLERIFLKELLQRNFDSCSKAELAKTSFKIGVNGEPRFKSRYQRFFGINNFIKVLECNNNTLLNSDLLLFTNIHTLKVLSEGIAVSHHHSHRFHLFTNLKHLSISLSTLINVRGLFQLVAQLERLDLFWDFSLIAEDTALQLHEKTTLLENTRLKELNLFSNEVYCLKYTKVVNWLELLPLKFHQLSSLTLRLASKSSINVGNWQAYDTSDYSCFIKIMKILRQLPYLSHFAFDKKFVTIFDCLQSMVLDPEFLLPPCRQQPLVVTLVDKTPDLIREMAGQMIGYVLQYLHVTQLNHQFGIVVERPTSFSYHNSSMYIDHIVSPFSTRNSPIHYRGLKRICSEQCWSPVEDAEIRQALNICVDTVLQSKDTALVTAAKKMLKLASVSSIPQGVIPNLDFRRRRLFLLKYYNFDTTNYTTDEIAESWSTLDHGFSIYPDIPTTLDANAPHSSQSFWGVQASLIEMEQYCLQPKPLSNLWR